MAQKKLLFVVIMLAVIAYTYRVFADVNDEEWANNLSQDAMNMTWQNLKNQLEEFKIYGDRYNHHRRSWILRVDPLNFAKSYPLHFDLSY